MDQMREASTSVNCVFHVCVFVYSSSARPVVLVKKHGQRCSRVDRARFSVAGYP